MRSVGWPMTLSLVCLGAGLLSSLLVRLMIRAGPLDMPGHRSAHDRPTPRGGGVGVVAAFLVGVPLAGWLHGDDGVRQVALYLGGVGLLALVAWLDDLLQFRPWLKLAAQAAAALLVLAGVGTLPLQGWGLAIGFAWLMFVTNALNFIDGLNGLAGGSMALSGLYIGLVSTGGLQTQAGLVLAAGLAGFLPFNMPRARIFLGDVGSQGAGLAIAGLGLLHWQHVNSSILTMPLLLAGILYDVALTLCRRLLAAENLSQAHRGHLYQVAFRSGVGATTVAVLHWGFVAWGGILAYALALSAISWEAALLLALAPQFVLTWLVWRWSRSACLGRW